MLIIGTALVALGLIAVWLILENVGARAQQLDAHRAAAVAAGVGNGFFIAPNAQFIVATVDPVDAGSASGVIAAVQRVGTAVGIAVIGSVFFGTLSFPSDRRPTSTTWRTRSARSATAALLVSAAFAVVAFLLVFTLPRTVGRRRRRSGGGPRGGGGRQPLIAAHPVVFRNL